MVSVKAIQEMIYNALEGFDVTKLKELHDITAFALIDKERAITCLTEQLAGIRSQEVEGFIMKKLRIENESHRILTSRLKAIDRRIEEFEDQEEEGEEFTGFGVPVEQHPGFMYI